MVLKLADAVDGGAQRPFFLFLPFAWILERAELKAPHSAAVPGEPGPALPSDCRGLLNLLFARFIPGIRSNKLMSDCLILNLLEEFRPLWYINRMLTRLTGSLSASGAQAFGKGSPCWRILTLHGEGLSSGPGHAQASWATLPL